MSDFFADLVDAFEERRRREQEERAALLAENQRLDAERDMLRRSLELEMAEKQRLREALETARPYVYNVMSDRRMNKDWRHQTAYESLRTVDEALAGEDT